MDPEQTAPKVRVYHICFRDKILSEVHLNIKQTAFSNFLSFTQSFLFEVNCFCKKDEFTSSTGKTFLEFIDQTTKIDMFKCNIIVWP